MNSTIKVGLVGCGYWGRKHLRVFNEVLGCEVTALCEPNAQALDTVPRSLIPAFVTGDYDEFLNSGIDAVVIATPARTHFDLGRRALEAGKHTLIEKPFATNTREAKGLIVAAEKLGLTLMVGHTYIYHPAVAMLKEMIDSGELGQLHYVHTSRLNFGLLQPDVDVLWDLAPHDLSILLHLLQQEPLVAGARGTAGRSHQRYEVAHVDLEFLDGLLAHIHVSWLEPVKVRRLTLIGSEKIVVYDDVDAGQAIRIYNKSIRMQQSEVHPERFLPQYLNGDINIPFLPETEPLKAEGAHFLECIRTGARPVSDGWAGLQVVRVLESVERSLYNGGTMETLTPDLMLAMEQGRQINPQRYWAYR